jgi:hypothetical protein
MATIGQALTAPESGWRRYDDTDSRILYTGTLSKSINYSGDYNSSYTQSNTNGSTIFFKFYGSNFRILSNYYSDKSNSIDVYVDGIKINNFSEYYNGAAILQCLVYQKTGLNLGVHTVKLINNTSNYMMLDSIDIDSTGYLVHPILNQVSSLENMQVGDCIPCRYTASTSGSTGYFSDLGNPTPISNNIIDDGVTVNSSGAYNGNATNKVVISSLTIPANSIINTIKCNVGTGSTCTAVKLGIVNTTGIIKWISSEVTIVNGIATINNINIFINEISYAAVFYKDGMIYAKSSGIIYNYLSSGILYSNYTIGSNLGIRSSYSGFSSNFYCDYATFVDEIPITGTTTPDGLFYFIKTNKGTLIADRVVQTSISWDALNTTKYIEGNKLCFNKNLIPIMTSNTVPFGIVSSYSTWSNNGGEYKAFNNNITNGDTWYSGTLPSWLCYEFSNNTLINAYEIFTEGNYGRYPSNWTFEASNDSTNWITLDTQNNIIWSGTGISKLFIFNNSITYKKYRINITSANGYTNTMIGELKMYNLPNIIYKIRSLSGGVAYADASGNSSVTNQNLGAWPPSNEWDTYLVKSTLNGKITPGDNNIWHWNNLHSACKGTVDVAINNSSYRVYRGISSSSSNNPMFQTLSATSTNFGFRPVLEYIETNSRTTNLFY